MIEMCSKNITIVGFFLNNFDHEIGSMLNLNGKPQPPPLDLYLEIDDIICYSLFI